MKKDEVTDEDEGNPLFGDWTGIPRGIGARYVPAPVGMVCMWCDEPIGMFDSGEILHVASKEQPPASAPVHRECMLIGIIGHKYGICSCTGYAGAPSMRAAALELERQVFLRAPGRPTDRN